MTPTWAVVATVDEPAPLILAFAAWHLSLGASEVHLFLDRPDAETEAGLARLPGCRVTICNEVFWATSEKRKRPKLHVWRQGHNARMAYHSTKADWLLHLDADEFVRDATAMVTELARAPTDSVYMRLAVAERVWSPTSDDGSLFSGIFRHAMPDFASFGPQIYGDRVAFFRDGLTGHKAGKALVRTGLDIEMGIHSPAGRQPHRVLKTTRMLHFDGLTRLHYMIKLLKRAHEKPGRGSDRHGVSRVTQFQALRACMTDPTGRDALVEALKTLDDRQVQLLRRFGFLDERGFDPRPALQELAPDLSAARFDADLRLRHADFLVRYAPDLAAGVAQTAT
jgi:hypothetical protein